MASLTYQQRRAEIEEYFDQTAAEAWSRLTSDAPVSRIRRTVRAGRDRMRNTILEWLPEELEHIKILDAGCGTGALSIEAAMRGADVIGADLSPKLIEVARKRLPENLTQGSIELVVGDMSEAQQSEFDHIVCMDSLIHYNINDVIKTLVRLSSHCRQSIIFTFAPSTLPLQMMHAVGRLFPRSNRAPSIVPVNERKLRQMIAKEEKLTDWEIGKTLRIKSGFYTSQAMELKHR